jgi:hypothetical protein
LRGVEGQEASWAEEKPVVEAQDPAPDPEEKPFEAEPPAAAEDPDEAESWTFAAKTKGLYCSSGEKYEQGFQRMRQFFYDLADYHADSQGVAPADFWSTLSKNLREGKILEKNGSYLRSDERLWEALS